jgi:uncharacterized protein involved in type VI secretion and phage assembly
MTGAPNDGVVTCHRRSDTTTGVMLQMADDPQGVVEHSDAMLGVVLRRAANDVERCKALIDARGQETEAWGDCAAGPRSAPWRAPRVCPSPFGKAPSGCL